MQYNGQYSVSLRRFDTGENITIEPDQEVDIDEETAEYLENYKAPAPVVDGKVEIDGVVTEFIVLEE